MGNLMNEKGSALILTTLAMLTLLGFAALALDGGYLYYRQLQTQDISDAIALAAGQELPDRDAALSKVDEYAKENSIEILSTETISSTSDELVEKKSVMYAGQYPGEMLVKIYDNNLKMKVNLSIESELFFAKVLGHDSSEVGASATVGRSKQLAAYSEGLVPIGIVDNTFQPGESYNLSYGPPSVSGATYSGNFGFINLDSYLAPENLGTNNAGSTNFSSYLETGYSGEETFEVGGSFNTITGEKVGQVKNAINTSIPRNIIIPLISTLVDATGVERVQIIGFAEFRLTQPYDDKNKIIVGEFVKRIEPGPGTSTTSSSSVPIESFKLIE